MVQTGGKDDCSVLLKIAIGGDMIMLGSIQKLARNIIFIAACIGSISNLIDPISSLAQEPKGEGTRPPYCEGSPPTGRVKCNYEGGDNYEGDFVNGKPDGKGIYVYVNGDRYDGMFRNGLPNGRGLFIFKDDARYDGVFENGTMKQGTVVFPNGNRYIGEFQVVRNVETNVISSQPGGRGQFIYVNGDRYVGQFFAGSPFGPGVLTRTDGTRCTGQFLNQDLDAKAKCTFPSGIRYEGELRKGIPHGVGTMIDTKGRRFPGIFRAGKLME
jgi:hypothetical protein